MTRFIKSPALPVGKCPGLLKNGCIATLGVFDGLHLGHQELIHEVVRRAKAADRASLVISLWPHPQAVLQPGVLVPRISSIREQLRVLTALGVDLFYALRFTQALSHLTPEDFVQKILIGGCGAIALVLGPDAAIGANRRGDRAFLTRYLPNAGLDLFVQPFREQGGHKIGSGTIRKLILEGRVDEAAEFLGRPFEVEGKVVHGDRRGTALGFPTANLRVPLNDLLPPGVFATRCYFPGGDPSNGGPLNGITNVGTRPTFDGTRVSVETHLINFPHKALYGCRLRIQFVKLLRSERRFPSIDHLRAQLEQDRDLALEILREI